MKTTFSLTFKFIQCPLSVNAQLEVFVQLHMVKRPAGRQSRTDLLASFSKSLLELNERLGNGNDRRAALLLHSFRLGPLFWDC